MYADKVQEETVTSSDQVHKRMEPDSMNQISPEVLDMDMQRKPSKYAFRNAQFVMFCVHFQ